MRSVDLIVNTLLHEGTTLYPYRPSALKNRFRFAFGCCYPRTWTAAHPDDPCRLDAAVLLEAGPEAEVTVELRFLQPSGGDGDPYDRAATVARAAPPELRGHRHELAFDRLAAVASANAEEVRVGVWRIALTVHNIGRLEPAASRDEALVASLASTHFVVHTSSGRFVSVQDPPPELAELAAACHGPPLWPFLAGADDVVVCSPIVVEDHAAIAPESAGDFFDGTEIDEMLTLRVLTMTEAELHEAEAASPKARALIERCRRLSPQARSRLWGAVTAGERRSFAGTGGLQPGDRVRLQPRARADAMDAILRGREATITGSETDLEGRRWLTVVIDGDPGADLGRAGLPGHRFFFGEEEVEPL